MDKEAATRAILYGIKDPLVTVYDAIEELEKLGTPAGLPYSVEQFVVLFNDSLFECAIVFDFFFSYCG